jgi:acetylornithine aminotransferase
MSSKRRKVDEETLLAERLQRDPRVAEAKRLLLAAVADHGRQLDEVRPPDPELEMSYDELIGRLEEVRGAPLYYPYVGSGLGRGPLVELADGSVKYDFICGIGVHYFGHSHPALVEAGIDAAIEDVVMQGNLQQNREAAFVGELLLSAAKRKGAELDHVFLTTSGAMANENALKMVLQKKTPADRIIAFEGCFAGRTLALSQITDRPGYREGLPSLLAVDYVPFFDPANPTESTEGALRALRGHLARYPGRHAAVFLELVLGESGYYPGDADFFRALMGAARGAGLAVVVDEVQTFGRTTEPFAFQHYGLDDLVDVATVGKLTQVCATLFRDEYRPRPGLVSQTFTGGTAAMLAACAILTEMQAGDYFGSDGRIAAVHDRFVGRLREIGERHPGAVRGPYGIGAMIAFTPFDGEAETAKRIAGALFEAGVIAFTTGDAPTRIRFLPPVGAVTEEDIDAVAAIVEEVLGREGRAPE